MNSQYTFIENVDPARLKEFACSAPVKSHFLGSHAWGEVSKKEAGSHIMWAPKKTESWRRQHFCCRNLYSWDFLIFIFQEALLWITATGNC